MMKTLRNNRSQDSKRKGVNDEQQQQQQQQQDEQQHPKLHFFDLSNLLNVVTKLPDNQTKKEVEVLLQAQQQQVASSLPLSSLLLHKEEPQAFLVTTDDMEDSNSVESCSVAGTDNAPSSPSNSNSNSSRWRHRYQPPPIVSQNTILAIGFTLFLVACVWPPLLLLIAYLSSKIIPYSFRINDDACRRRQLFRDFSLIENHPEKFKHVPEHIQIEESYWINERGMALSTVTMLPRNRPIRAIVTFCHGYTDNVSYSKKVEYQRLVDRGIAFVGIEYEGHGRSDGPLGLIPSWELLINDVSSYFQHVIEKRFDANIPVFLMGESMGGAVAYSVYNRNPTLYKGVVFVCPMCKISDDMLPPQWVIALLRWLIGPSPTINTTTGSSSSSTYITTSLLGYLPIAPSKNDLFDVAHHLPEKAELFWRCPTTFGRNPRLATARELLDATKRISDSLSDFDAPFLVVHGREDRVTDPQLSLALYKESCSDDKTIRLYDGMWHSLTSSEPDDSIDRVFRDCTDWILDRCQRSNDKKKD